MNTSTQGADALLTETGPGDTALIEFDPLYDEPPFTPNPTGSEAEQNLATITYLGAIARVYAEDGHGAITEEVVTLAKKAGYENGARVNGWNSRSKSPRAIVNKDGQRFLNEASIQWVLSHAASLGIKLVGEYKTVPSPEM